MSQRETITVNDTPYLVQPIWRSDLSSPAGAADYVAEGTPNVSVRDGWYWIDAREGQHPRHFSTVWLPGDYPADLRIRYKAHCPAPAGSRNINFFFHARLENGADVVTTTAERTGDYGEYHVFPNYIFTYLGDDQLRARMRRDPGFELLAEAFFPGGVPLDTDIELEIRMADGWIEYHELAPTRRLLLRHHDPTPHTGGRIGLRTWKTHVGFADIQVDRIVSAE